MAWYNDVWDFVTGQSGKTYANLAKTGVAALSTYASFKDQQKKNQMAQDALDDYLAQADAAGHAARAAIDVNYTPMTVSGVPTSKADVTDFTEVQNVAQGGLMSIPNKQRKRYARGPEEFEVMEMDDEVFSPGDFKMETGVDVLGEQVFYDTGKGDRSNAMQIWEQMQNPDKAIFDFDFEIFFMDGGWRDMIKSQVEVGTETQMASAPDPTDALNDMALDILGKPLHHLTPEEYQMLIDMANDQASARPAEGIMQAAKGGRIGYALGTGVESSPIDQMQEIEGQTAGPAGYHRILEEQMSLLAEELDKHPSDLSDSEYELAGNRAMEIWRSGGFAQGGRIGLQSGFNDPKNMTTEMLISIVQDGRSTPEILIELEKRIPGAIEQIKLEEGQGDQAFSIKQHILDQYDPDKRAVEEDFLYDLRENVDPNYREPMAPLPMMAKGGRIKKETGGIMDLGGLEKDYRTTGGFVPIGAYEKKDDVPARLSKNEFVFTADAVRAAGGGSINKGAQRMYDTMKNLEAQPTAKRMIA